MTQTFSLKISISFLKPFPVGVYVLAPLSVLVCVYMRVCVCKCVHVPCVCVMCTVCACAPCVCYVQVCVRVCVMCKCVCVPPCMYICTETFSSFILPLVLGIKCFYSSVSLDCFCFLEIVSYITNVAH